MPIQPRPELENVVPGYHGGVSREELDAIGVADVVDFSVNTNPLGPSPHAIAALASVDPSSYPDGETSLLRQELGQRLSVGVDNVIVGNGSVEIIWLASAAYLRSGDAVLILGPTFAEYEVASRIFGARVGFEMARAEDEFRPNVAAFAERVERERPRIVFVCNPNNPTGHLLAREEIERIVAAGEDSLVVIDEAYASLADVKTPRPLETPLRTETPHRGVSTGFEDLIGQPNVLLLRSLTKDFALAGLRIGYALAATGVIDALRRVRPPWSVNSFAQAAALASLRDEEHLKRSRQEIRAAKETLVAGLAELGLHTVPSRANFLLLRVGDGADFRRRLMRKGFCVRLCASFGLPEHVRIGVRTRSDCRGLLTAIEEVIRQN